MGAPLIKHLLNGESEDLNGEVIRYGNEYGYPSIYITEQNGSKITSIISVNSQQIYCPHCHKKSVKEYTWGYRCSNNCGFMLYKDAFKSEEENSPYLITRSMYEDLVTEGETDAIDLITRKKLGLITIENDRLFWYKDGNRNSTATKEVSLVKDFKQAKRAPKKRKTRKKS